ncbi:MAG: hypothetical protein U0U69_08445 [Acidimicrobiia bacterium]
MTLVAAQPLMITAAPVTALALAPLPDTVTAAEVPLIEATVPEPSDAAGVLECERERLSGARGR